MGLPTFSESTTKDQTPQQETQTEQVATGAGANTGAGEAMEEEYAKREGGS
ncbi:hypothetical protein BHE90_009263 [Fusarium euwallaceae]|uniref:Uncharacterized protein n=1 Tax=Fusarium euwallaceae TaxID=1147111 RepID=A0A430LKK4_9HYPO|nr:hypothetical protein BHE90_009263 [Fusarium euwallaceae]